MFVSFLQAESEGQDQSVMKRVVFENKEQARTRLCDTPAFFMKSGQLGKLLSPYRNGETTSEPTILLLPGIRTLKTSQVEESIMTLASQMERGNETHLESRLSLTQPWPKWLSENREVVDVSDVPDALEEMEQGIVSTEAGNQDTVVWRNGQDNQTDDSGLLRLTAVDR
jgi:hypothetical protein